MNLVEAIDFLAGNCPKVFAPIATELETLRTENEGLKTNLQATQEVVDFILMNGGM